MVEWLGWFGGTPQFRKPPYYGQLAEWYEMGFSLRTCGCRTEVTLMNRNIVSKLTIIFVVIWGVIVVKYIHTSKSDFLGILSVAISGTDLLEVPTVYKICVRAMSRATFQGICPQVLWLYIYGLYSASRLGTWSGHWYYGLKLSTHLPTTEPIPGTFLLTSFSLPARWGSLDFIRVVFFSFLLPSGPQLPAPDQPGNYLELCYYPNTIG